MKRHLFTIAAVLSTVMITLVTAAASPATALPPWQDTATSWTNPRATDPRVVDLRFAAHDNFDRVVIDVRGAIPSGSAHYARRFTRDGSGLPIPIGGRSGLSVDLSPARAHTQSGVDLYDGPMIARPRLDTLKALAFAGDFEGHVSFAFALTHRADYRVFWLHHPQRLVIDFRH